MTELAESVSLRSKQPVAANDIWSSCALIVSVLLLAAFAPGCGEDRTCWKKSVIRNDTETFADVDGFSMDRVYARSTQKGVYRYDGIKWDSMEGSPAGFCVLALSDNNIFAGGFRYNGTTWSKLLPGPYGLWDLWAESEDDIFTVGFERETIPGNPKAKIFHFDGNEWIEMENDSTALLHGVWGSSGNDVFAVGPERYDDFSDDGTILHYDGSAWTIMEENTPYGLYGVWGTSPTDVFAVGDRGLVLHYDGIEWSEMETPGRGKLVGVWGASPTEVYAVGDTILFYDGNTWSDIGDGVPGVYKSVWGMSATDLFVVGDTFEDYYTVGMILEYTCDQPGLARRP